VADAALPGVGGGAPPPGNAAASGVLLLAFVAGLGAFLALRSLLLTLVPGGVGAVAAAEWLGFALLPLLLLVARGVPVGGFLRYPGRRGLLGGAVLALAGLPMAELVGWLQSPWIQAEPAVVEALQRDLVPGTGPELLLLLFAAALTPALCEEFSFRGLLLSGAAPAGPWVAIGASSLAFGAVHWVPGGGFRVLPTAVLGLLAGWLAWRTASLLPPVLFHLLHNGGILLAASAGDGPGGAVAPPAVPGEAPPGLFGVALAITSIVFTHHLTRSP
jgi:membrane protease YdiL (CAAX protease family)